ncbi:unnamed protein product [Trifolium pratense]|uniref:Uncharacterized protein n=1 Tax=Trifolium pratense TaxID=57577 RepID=A0ACB0JXY7_TRIPR|nr:unnamed protein product [Trifolium pratense]
MTEYGVEESWTQLLKISFQNLRNILHNFETGNYYHWFPLYLPESCDTLILANYLKDQAILYNWRDNERTRISIQKSFWHSAKDYVESLVWYC